MTWETVTALLGVVGLIGHWLDQHGKSGQLAAHQASQLLDHETRLRAVESKCTRLEAKS